jgi:hypothetical protein
MTEILGHTGGSPLYEGGQPVRVYKDRGDGPRPEDDWEYRYYEESLDHEVAGRSTPDGRDMELARTPKPEFDEWQRQKAAEDAGRLAAGATLETTATVQATADEFIRAAERYHLRPETVELALGKGIKDPIDYLLKARRSEPLKKRLEQHGFDMRPPEGMEDPVVEDPISALNEEGNARRDEIINIREDLETDEGIRRLRASLKNPAPLPGGLHKVPVIGKRAGKALKAWKMLQKEKEHRPKTRIEKTSDSTEIRVPIRYNDGLFGLGLHEWREYYEYVTRLSAAIAADRTKLSPANRHEISGPLIEVRRNLAELILKDQYALNAANNNEVVPDEIYQHEPASALWKGYRASLNPEGLRADRETYVDLVNKSLRTAEENQKIRELEEKYPHWKVT